MTRRAGHYIKRTGDMICENIALGFTLAEAFAKIGFLAPTERQFWRWIDQNDNFRDQYERARQLQADKFADEHLELARAVLKQDGKQAPKFKVASDILKWQAEVRNRGKYSDKAPVKAAPPLNPEQIRAEIKRLEEVLGVVKPVEGEPGKLKVVK